MKRYQRKQKIRSAARTTIIFMTIVTVILLAAVATLMYKKNTRFSYETSLEKTVIQTSEENIPLKALSYYFMIEEESVNEVALTYDAEDPKAYWGLYVNNSFVCDEAMDTALDYFLRDHLYYNLAMQEGMSLTQEEWDEIYLKAEDIIEGMTKKQRSLRMTKEDIQQALAENQLADDYVLNKAGEQDLKMTEEVLSAYYGINSHFFKELKEEKQVVVNEKLLENIKMGSLTIN
ncbi:MAG: hypothetical protein ACI39H_02995 [Lachnospiraceae bacterium]